MNERKDRIHGNDLHNHYMHTHHMSMNYKSVCMCMHYISLILPFSIPRYPGYHVTPSTFLMSVSSASLSPRSKSTVRRAASCGHVLFLCAATSRATSCSMMAEEPLPPKPASTTSFRCKDGRSARPHRGCRFDPKNWTRTKEILEYRWTSNPLINIFKMMKSLTFWFFRGNLVESTCPPIQKQQSKTIIHFELQYVLGTPLAANQQLAMSTERNASSLHRIENQCASNERFTEVGAFAAVMWSSLVLGHFFEPKVCR